MAITYNVTVYDNGGQEWRLNDQLHREDGPAIIHPNGAKFWYFHGKFHREDGPAVEFTNGYKEYWLNGIQCTEAQFLAKTSPVKEMTMADVEALAGCRVKIVKE